MKRRIASFAHAFRGVRECIATGANAKIQLAAAFIVVATGFVLGFTNTEWLAVII